MSSLVLAQLPSPWQPGQRVGRYELLAPIGEGGMASVWVARLRGEHGFEKLVAIKTILSQYAADSRYETMFLDEARLIANIRHPNVAEILDLGSDHSLPYLVMEWVEGDSLALLQRAATENKRPIPVPSALHIAARMCAGLHAAHELRDRAGKRLDVVHRDVSPQNVLLSVTGEVKLIDFGIAKALDQLSADTHTGVLKGKVSFMSPEQANGQRLDRRADIWALGVVLYQLISGELPYRSDSRLKTLTAIRSGRRPPPIAGLPSRLQKLLDRALEPDRELRIESAAELESELERAAAQFGVVSSRDVSSLVAEHLGPRIGVRRAAIESALRAANGRSAPLRSVEPARRGDDTATAVIGPSVQPERVAPAQRSRAGMFAAIGVLAAAIALLTVGLRRPPPPAPLTLPAVAHPTAPAAIPAPAPVLPVVNDGPPVVRVEDVPLSPAPSASAPARRRVVPRKPRAPHPKRDVWSAFSEHR